MDDNLENDNLLDDLEQFDFISDEDDDSGDINNAPLSVHELMIQKFIEYSYWNERFERYGYVHSAKMARNALIDIHHLTKQRRAELLERSQFITRYKKRQQGTHSTDAEQK